MVTEEPPREEYRWISLKTINTRFALLGRNLDLIRNTSITLDYSNLILEIDQHHHKSSLVAIPAFFNAHIHAADIGLRGRIGTDLAMTVGPEGLKQKYLENLSDKELATNIIQAVDEAKNSGTLGFVDFREGGLKGLIPYQFLPKSFLPLGRPKIDEFSKISDPISVGIRDVMAYPPEKMVQLVNIIRQNQGKVEIHVSEDIKIRNRWLKEFGESDLIWAIKQLRPDAVVHGTLIDETDMHTLEKSNTALILCPSSNAYFKVGQPPVTDLLNYKITLGLGSDNAMVNSVNLWKEMALLKKWGVPTSSMLKMATVDGASTVGMNWGISKQSSNFLVFDFPTTYSEEVILNLLSTKESMRYLVEIIYSPPV